MGAAGVIAQLAKPMRDHLAKLDGSDGKASGAGESFSSANTSITDLAQRHKTAARAALDGWYGQQSGLFQERVSSVKKATTTLTANCTTISDVASTAVSAIRDGRTAIQDLIDEFIDKASTILTGAQAVGNDGISQQAIADATDLAATYRGKTAKELRAVRDALQPLVGRLTGLETVTPASLGGLGTQLGPPSDGSTTPAGYHGPGDRTPGTGPGIPGAGPGSYGTGSPSSGYPTGSTGPVGPRLPVAIPPQPGSGVGINLPDGSSAEAPNEIAAAAVRNALSALGTPYVWGAANPPSGTDCSGLTSWAYAGAGLEIPRHSSAQAIGASVPDASQLLPGDLVVWDGHVAMVVGNGMMIEAGDPVQLNPIRTDNIGMPFLGFYRPTG